MLPVGLCQPTAMVYPLTETGSIGGLTPVGAGKAELKKWFNVKKGEILSKMSINF